MSPGIAFDFECFIAFCRHWKVAEYRQYIGKLSVMRDTKSSH